MDATIQNMIGLAQQQMQAPVPRRVGEAGSNSVPASGLQTTSDTARADKAAKDYESVFISQFLGSMFSSIPIDSVTGGGAGEEMFRSLMIDQYAKSIEHQGGFGMATQMKAELLKHQQAALQ